MESRDIIQELALKMDLKTLSDFCSSSKRNNELVCKNNAFWVKRLKHDFDIDFWSLGIEMPSSSRLREKFVKEEVPARKYYYQNLSRLLFEFIVKGDLEKVKNAVNAGANINKVRTGIPLHPFPEAWEQALTHGHSDMAFFFLKKKDLSKKEVLIRIISSIIRMMEYNKISGEEKRKKAMEFLFDKIMPYTYNKPEFLRVWKISLTKLEEFKNQYNMNAVYDRKYPEIQAVIDRYEGQH